VTGPPTSIPPFLNNALAAQELLTFLGVKDKSQRFEVLPLVMPVAIVAEPQPAVDTRFAWGTMSQGAGGAGTFSMNQLFNPADSGVVIHVDAVNILADAGQTIHILEFDTALTTEAGTKGFRDRRLRGEPAGQVRTQANNPILGVNRFRTAVEAANVAVFQLLDVFLNPGQGVHISGVGTNNAIFSGWLWDETNI